MAGELNFELLGSPTITLGGAALPSLRYAKAQALLCYLALTGRPHSREALGALFWGESPDKDARNNLRGVLGKLAHALPEHLERRRDRVALGGAYALDVTMFLSRLQEADADALGEAADLYRGDLLEGLRVQGAPAFEEWLAGERERLRQLALQALYSLARYHGERGEHAPGIRYLGRLLSLEPWREDAHRQLMALLAESGQQDAALAQYQACRRVLEAELGLEPTAETTALHDRIRAGELTPPPAPRHNLPLLPTALLGRGEELARVAERLAAPECRLLTLYGAGGVGKTSLALGAARAALGAFPGGVFFVPLAAVSDPGLVPATIAQALELRETAAQPLLEALTASLRGKQALLVLDNLEHLLAAAPVVSALLGACPPLKVLATSREVLRLRGEHELDVPPLAVPDLRGPLRPETLLAYPSVALFCERARAVKPDFRLTDANAPAVAALCVRLDGLPLALELAAARVKVMTMGELLERLVGASGGVGATGRLPLLTGGARDLPEHQRTLQRTIAWSHELLEPDLKRLFARLAVFVGGFGLEAAEAVCAEGDALEGVARLVDKSLLRREDGGGAARFKMLETIREYAQARLEASGEGATLGHRHAAFFVALAEQAESHLQGAEQLVWLERLERDHDNLRAALSWADATGDGATTLRLCAVLWRLWATRGPLGEGREWLTRALEAETAVPELRARALRGAGVLAELQGDYGAARALAEESLSLYRQLGDKRGVATALGSLGILAQEQGDLVSARGHFEEGLALAGELSDEHVRALAFNNLGALAEGEGDLAAARSLYERGLAAAQETGNAWTLTLFLITLGATAHRLGDVTAARPLLEESLARVTALGDQEFAAYALEAVAALLAGQGEAERAARLYGAAARLREATGVPLRPRDRPRHERAVAAARGALDEERFGAAWAEGRAMSMEDAVAHAQAAP